MGLGLSLTTMVESPSDSICEGEEGEEGGEGVVGSGFCIKALNVGNEVVRETGTKDNSGDSELAGLEGD